MYDLTNYQLVALQRRIIWEEAKGWLRAMAVTFTGSPVEQKHFEEKINEFIEDIQDTVL